MAWCDLVSWNKPGVHRILAVRLNLIILLISHVGLVSCDPLQSQTPGVPEPENPAIESLLGHEAVIEIGESSYTTTFAEVLSYFGISVHRGGETPIFADQDRVFHITGTTTSEDVSGDPVYGTVDYHMGMGSQTINGTMELSLLPGASDTWIEGYVSGGGDAFTIWATDTLPSGHGESYFVLSGSVLQNGGLDIIQFIMWLDNSSLVTWWTIYDVVFEPYGSDPYNN